MNRLDLDSNNHKTPVIMSHWLKYYPAALCTFKKKKIA